MKLAAELTDEDLQTLTLQAHEDWQVNLNERTITRKVSSSRKTRIQALYRMIKEVWARSSDAQKFSFPFSQNSFRGVIGLNKDWQIPLSDRKFLEDDMILFASDERTILVFPIHNKKWWETHWFNGISLFIGILGIVLGTIGIYK